MAVSCIINGVLHFHPMVRTTPSAQLFGLSLVNAMKGIPRTSARFRLRFGFGSRGPATPATRRERSNGVSKDRDRDARPPFFSIWLTGAPLSRRDTGPRSLLGRCACPAEAAKWRPNTRASCTFAHDIVWCAWELLAWRRRDGHAEATRCTVESTVLPTLLLAITRGGRGIRPCAVAQRRAQRC
jgi:hypothetical protein